MRLWKTETGELAATFKGFSGNIESMEFSPDGKILAMGAEAGAVLISVQENIRHFPVIVTPYLRVGVFLFRCPNCMKIHQIDKSSIGREVNCRDCDQKVKLNPFFLERPEMKLKRKRWWRF